MRRMRVCAAVSGTALVALLARVLVVGASPAIGLAAAITACLLVACLALIRQGRRLESHVGPTSQPRNRLR